MYLVSMVFITTRGWKTALFSDVSEIIKCQCLLDFASLLCFPSVNFLPDTRQRVSRPTQGRAGEGPDHRVTGRHWTLGPDQHAVPEPRLGPRRFGFSGPCLE